MSKNRYPDITTAMNFAKTFCNLTDIEKIRVESYMQGVMGSRSPENKHGELNRDSA
jgi:hypothetical protein